MDTGASNPPFGLPSGLCGWFGDGSQLEDPSQALEAMATGLAPKPSSERPLAEWDHALHLSPGSESSTICQIDDLTLAIEGHPRWSDPALAAMAAAQGFGAALAHAYRSRGAAFLEVLEGTFALALLDPKARRCLLAIDRMGIHALCYGRTRQGGIVFGSNATSVAAHPSIEKAISAQAIYNYLLFFYVPGPGSIYDSQTKLLPAQYLLYEDGEVRSDFYWQAPYGSGHGTDMESLKSRLFESLRTSVDRSIVGESPERIGAFLSGGLDSSAVVGVLAEATDRPVKSFTIGFANESHDETPYAEAAAHHFKSEHHLYRVTPQDVHDLIPQIAAAFDEPFGNASVVPTYCCARLARQHGVDLMIAGDGGDELFAGNPWYPRQQVFALYEKVPKALRRRLIEPLVFGLPGAERIDLLRKARKYITIANQPMPDRGFRPEAAVVSDIRDIVAPDIYEQVDANQPLEVLRAAYFRAGSEDLVQRMMHLDLETVLAGCDIRKVSRMCALAGVRVRFPLLDQAVVEMSTEVPPDLLLHRFKLRHFYRRAMAEFLPQAVLSKHKHGFGLPWAQMLAEQPMLRDLAYDTLNMAKRRGLVLESYIDQLVKQQQRHPGSAPHAGPIWDMMILELWMQSHMD
ncbi:MAG: asparagine synthase-related protein [Pseudomonadota bacterium]